MVKETGKGDYTKKEKGKYIVDLQAANRVQALGEGVLPHHISVIEECTYCYPLKFHSYRYAMNNNLSEKEKKRRQGGFIGLP